MRGTRDAELSVGLLGLIFDLAWLSDRLWVLAALSFAVLALGPARWVTHRTELRRFDEKFNDAPDAVARVETSARARRLSFLIYGGLMASVLAALVLAAVLVPRSHASPSLLYDLYPLLLAWGVTLRLRVLRHWERLHGAVVVRPSVWVWWKEPEPLVVRGATAAVGT